MSFILRISFERTLISRASSTSKFFSTNARLWISFSSFSSLTKIVFGMGIGKRVNAISPCEAVGGKCFFLLYVQRFQLSTFIYYVMGVLSSVHNGDSGSTSLIGGEVVKKNSSVIRILGEIDELMAVLGVVFARRDLDENKKAAIKKIQADLFAVNSFLAGSENLGISLDDVAIVEEWTKGLVGERGTGAEEGLKPRQGGVGFAVPGCKGEISAQFHVSRVVARKCERTFCDFLDDGRLSEKLTEASIIRAYLNRLSDLFFAMAEC